MQTVVKKKKVFKDVLCEECVKDPAIKCPRDPDVQCLHCGTKLCGFHMNKHLKDKHCVSTTWMGL